MSPSDEMQRLFDRAQAALPASPPRSPRSLHERLRRRRNRTRVGCMACGVAFVAAGVTAAISGPTRETPATVTLYPQSTRRLRADQLAADRAIMAYRLRSIGYRDATVSVVNDTIVVTNGPSDLADSASLLTSSPAVLIRPV